MFSTRRRFATLVSGSLAATAFARGLPAMARGDDGGYRPPNVFISPHGRPFRAVDRAPYPVVDWFREANHKGDGKLDRDEFAADAASFFDVLDLNGDGALDTDEISFYEHNIAPEVLGLRVTVYAGGVWRARPDAPRLWLAQNGPAEGPFDPNGSGQGGLPGGPGQPGMGPPSSQGGVLPPDVQPNSPARPNPEADLSQLTGATPYSLFPEPEPVTAGDPDYISSGRVRKDSFLAHARDNFARLDVARGGYLTLAGLPWSPVQRVLKTGRLD